MRCGRHLGSGLDRSSSRSRSIRHLAAYGPVRDAVRAMGPDVRLAVDDAGAGVANFNHLVELRPQFVKIDAGLVRGVDDDLSRQALVAGILHFADTAGCEVIAEGIETDAERDMLERLASAWDRAICSADRHPPRSGPRRRPDPRRPSPRSG